MKGIQPRVSTILLAWMFTAGLVYAQSTRPRAGAVPQIHVAEAKRIEHPPQMDGALKDPLWQQAPPIADFHQREPFEGQPATERTEVRILYTRNAIYFGISCHSSAANRIVATQLRRDVTQELDDYFEIVIDAKHDRRNAYVFQINPLGTQRDALITDEQMNETQDGDPGWDGIWTSEARVNADGWTATVEIPFSTLNFMRSRNVVWGINFKRFIRSKNEEDLWSAWRRAFGIAKISQAGELHGITEIGSGRLFIVKPYALGGFSHLPASTTASGLTPGTSGLHTGGLDIKLGIRSNPPPIAAMRGWPSASANSGTASDCPSQAETFRLCSGLLKLTTLFRGSSRFRRSFRWIPPTTRRPAQTFACAGIIDPIAISS